jgi:hypothetical protein
MLRLPWKQAIIERQISTGMHSEITSNHNFVTTCHDNVLCE